MKWTYHYLIIIFIAITTGCAVDLTDDSVLSQHIAEVDGTTGQDTNTGSGIKTGHIQNDAVTAAKIGFYHNIAIVAISGGHYSNPAEAMENVDQWCAPDTYCLVKLMPGTYNIGENSVHMRGHVDIEGSGEGVTRIIGSLDSYDSGVVIGASRAELRFLTVFHSGGGKNAIAIYNNRASPHITHVTAHASNGETNNYGISNVEDASPIISHVKADAIGGEKAIAISNFNAGDVSLTSVQAGARDAQSNHGINNYRSSVRITDSTAIGSGGKWSFGIGNGESGTMIRNVLASASGASDYSYGVYNGGESDIALHINHSVIIGTTYSVTSSNGALTYVGSTQLNGKVFDLAGDTICSGVYDATYKPLDAECK